MPRHPSDSCASRPGAARGRRQALAALAGMAALLAGCQTPPPAPARPSLTELLSAAGFIESDQGWTLNLDSQMLFAFESDALTDQALAAIARLSKVLQEIGIQQLRVEGHTDNVGTSEFNQRLSMRRAEAVAREFAARGLPRASITTHGHGMAKPIADNKTEAGRAQNRRVVVIIPSL